MKVVFPIKLSSWQSFLYYHGAIAICIFITMMILSFIVLCVFTSNKVSEHVALPFGFGAFTVLAMLISIAGIFVIGIGGQAGLPDKTKNTVYDTDVITCNNDLHWTAGASPMDNQPMYLKISGDNKLVKCTWTTHTQTLKPCNNAGRAYMAVANKIYKVPRPKSDIKMNVTLAYAKGSVMTENGVKKFICYSNNKGVHKTGYKVLKY